ncbi:hypothetical protein BDZ89DRAFT_1126955 [Hymenopellis radicata]|nr:hypothetical protein BDZ89DRAFT_1126955 [Hymenopellis radicata]
MDNAFKKALSATSTLPALATLPYIPTPLASLVSCTADAPPAIAGGCRRGMRKAIFGTWSPGELTEPPTTDPAPNELAEAFERLRHLLDAISFPVKEVVPPQGTIDPKLLCAERANDEEHVQPFPDILNEPPTPSNTLEPKSPKEQASTEERDEVLNKKVQMTEEDDQIDIPKGNTVEKEQKKKKPGPYEEEYRRNFADPAYHQRACHQCRNSKFTCTWQYSLGRPLTFCDHCSDLRLKCTGARTATFHPPHKTEEKPMTRFVPSLLPENFQDGTPELDT